MSLLLGTMRYWREILTAAAVLALVGMCHARDTAIADRARAEVQYRAADSTLRAIAPRVARVDTLLVRDTVVVRQTIARVTTLRDTVLQHLTDTVLVREFVTRADSAAHACTELSNDCQQFRSFAIQRFAQDSIKLATRLTPSVAAPRFGFKTGAVAGAAAVIGALWLSRSISPHP